MGKNNNSSPKCSNRNTLKTVLMCVVSILESDIFCSGVCTAVLLTDCAVATFEAPAVLLTVCLVHQKQLIYLTHPTHSSPTKPSQCLITILLSDVYILYTVTKLQLIINQVFFMWSSQPFASFLIYHSKIF